MSGLTSVGVSLGERSYEVLIGPGASGEVSRLLPKSARRAVVVTQAGIGVSLEPGLDHVVVEIGRGEESKSMRTVEQLGRSFASFGLTRSDVVIALGGGLVTDVAGFAAASWHRGTPVVHVATTLLAQVDAAIGGKTGVNLPEGKNLMGAFWQPHGVICDTETLETLPFPEWRSGLGEMAKYAFIGVDDLAELPLTDQVAACVSLKARIVSADERESGARMILNYGHTLAHALEATGFAGDTASGGALRHGEAVAVGLCFAARLARGLGRIGDARVAEHDALVAFYELPARLPPAIDVSELIALMSRDKKANGDLTFVLDGPRGVEVVPGVPPGLVEDVLEEMRDAGEARAAGERRSGDLRKDITP
ncbi:MAG: 3-dehydroquinate synthase family protein [Acidimicrobiales bacterium]